ncbi:MAG TPA: hypothetical protein VHP11_00045 [Tepidisphaeraceae bacterium]|nr:hypothetical protein [Tepidisphaeraceae bacterium]
MKRLSTLAMIAVLLAAGCKARKDYPEPAIGYHTPNFEVVFGRLAAVRGATPEAEPIWVVRFGERRDVYEGELALEPAGRPVGFSGGELVEVRGQIVPPSASAPANDAYNGRRYAWTSLQLWSGYRQ